LRYGSLGTLVALFIVACASTEASPESQRKPSIDDPPADLMTKTSEAGDDCGPELSTVQYAAQCSDEDFAMLCLKADPTQKRCACKRGGRYYWTSAYYCRGRLLCESQRCR
jgi:hypothetical protein